MTRTLNFNAAVQHLMGNSRDLRSNVMGLESAGKGGPYDGR